MGVDPGFSGGLALYSTLRGALVDVWPMPTMTVREKKRVNAAVLSSLISDAMPDYVLIEQVGAMPGQGVTSMFSFGRGVGTVEGVCGALRVPIKYITPQTWRGKVGLRGDKTGARALATQLFPAHAKRFELVKSDGLAEAALIAFSAVARPAA